VTNNKFFTHFLDWQVGLNSSKNIIVVNDRTKSNEDRLGSLGDIKYVVENMKVTEDIMVIAGDNLFEFSLVDVFDIYKEKKTPVVALYDVGEIELAKLYGIVSVDDDGKIIDFEEKPKNPKSTLSSTGIYVYPSDIVKKLFEFTKDNDSDKAGDFLEWLYKKEDIFCFVTEERWFDIGSLDQLEKAKKEFKA
jgi:glucose-1-phosphate thymidylyltransferase